MRPKPNWTADDPHILSARATAEAKARRKQLRAHRESARSIERLAALFARLSPGAERTAMEVRLTAARLAHAQQAQRLGVAFEAPAAVSGEA